MATKENININCTPQLYLFKVSMGIFNVTEKLLELHFGTTLESDLFFRVMNSLIYTNQNE